MTMTRPTITIVEDDAGVRTGLQQLLRSAGYGAETFASAEAFLAARGGSDVECLIADINLPGMSGVALLQKLTADTRRLPAILMTGRDDQNTVELIRQAAPIPYLRKPFSDDELFNTIRSVLAA